LRLLLRLAALEPDLCLTVDDLDCLLSLIDLFNKLSIDITKVSETLQDRSLSSHEIVDARNQLCKHKFYLILLLNHGLNVRARFDLFRTSHQQKLLESKLHVFQLF
jgi:hypothetical protein